MPAGQSSLLPKAVHLPCALDRRTPTFTSLPLHRDVQAGSPRLDLDQTAKNTVTARTTDTCWPQCIVSRLRPQRRDLTAHDAAQYLRIGLFSFDPTETLMLQFGQRSYELGGWQTFLFMTHRTLSTRSTSSIRGPSDSRRTRHHPTNPFAN